MSHPRCPSIVLLTLRVFCDNRGKTDPPRSKPQGLIKMSLGLKSLGPKHLKRKGLKMIRIRGVTSEAPRSQKIVLGKPHVRTTAS